MNFASTATLKPRWWEWAIFGLLTVLSLAFGVLVVYRSAMMSERHTDFEVYARAGWAVRTNRSIYEVTDGNGLHYCYPPTFAVLIAPLADPPPGVDRAGYFPFAGSVAVWYAISILAMIVAVHWLSSAIERSASAPTPVGCRRWWWHRVCPVTFCIPGIGNTLSHGQVNLVLLLLICGMLAAAINGRSIRAGLWLAAAIALKIIPGFLALIALRKRDVRWIGATAVGLVILLVGVPALIWGPSQAIRANLRFVEVMIQPALGSATSSARGVEMFDILRTDNQSIQAVLHTWQHWNSKNPPAEPSITVRAAHWLIGVVMTIVTLRATRGRALQGNDLVLFAGALIVVMLLLSPMCHLHYYCLVIPLVLGLLHDAQMARDGMWMGGRLAWSLAFIVTLNSFPLIFEQYRNLGFAPIGTIPLWVEAVRALRRDSIDQAYVLPYYSRLSA